MTQPPTAPLSWTKLIAVVLSFLAMIVLVVLAYEPGVL